MIFYHYYIQGKIQVKKRPETWLVTNKGGTENNCCIIRLQSFSSGAFELFRAVVPKVQIALLIRLHKKKKTWTRLHCTNRKVNGVANTTRRPCLTLSTRSRQGYEESHCYLWKTTRSETNLNLPCVAVVLNTTAS